MEVKRLEKIGLSKNEIKCYLSLLKLGFSSANEISRKSGVHRISVYDSLRGLREKGLISQVIRSNKLMFEAANPEIILEIIRKKEDDLNTIKKMIPSFIDDFNSKKNKQEISSFKGLVGIKNILNEINKSKTEVLDFGAEYKIKEFFPYYYIHWNNERIKKKIKMRILANIKFKPTKIALTEIKYVSSKSHSSASTYIFDGKVALIMWVDDPLGVIIEHPLVYESYKNYFEYLWKMAKS